MENLFMGLKYTGAVIFYLTQPLQNSLLTKAGLRLLKIYPRKEIQKNLIPKNLPKFQTQRLKMLKSIHDIYSKEETFLDFFAHDLDDSAVWFNNSEFARFHDVNGKKILSIFTTNVRTQKLNIAVNEQYPDGITKSSGVLFCRSQELKNVKSGQSLKLNGKLYTVSDTQLIQDQVWRIVLEANNG